MKLLLTLAALFAAIAFACAEDDSAVLVLTDANFDAAIQEHDLVLVKFYAPWCGHCKRLAPEYDAAADELAAAGDRGVLAKVDCTEETEVAARFGIRGYPTLKLFVNNNVAAPKEFQGERTKDGLVSYMRKKAEPAVHSIASSDALKELVAQDGSLAVLFSADADAIATFSGVAADLEAFSFAHVSDASIADAFDAKVDSVVIFRDFSDENASSGLPESADALTEFINANGFPLVVEIGQEAYQRLATQPKPIVIFVFDDEEQDREQWIAALTQAAEANTDVSVTFGGKAGLARAVESFGGTGEVFPTVIGMKTPALAEADESVATTALPERFSFNEDNEVTAESVKKFIGDVAKGSIDVFKKSEPLPEDNSGPVTTLVHKNFDTYVKDGNNVFIKFYAPWCGHCKSLAPTWEELGEKFADSDVVIGKFDATANFLDDRFDVQGFPTLVFVSADGEQERYNGERDLDSLAAFVSSKIASDTAHDEL